jgi:hypothetical protein
MTNAQKTPLSRTLSQYVSQRATDEIRKRGRSLPGTVLSVSGSIVTVNLDLAGKTLPRVTMPVFGPEFIRYPIQIGDKGVCFPVDVSIAGVSGLGSGTPDDTLQTNLSTLVWFPVGNKGWTAPPGSDGNTLALYGHLALLLLDSINADSSVKLASNGITLTFGSGSITMNSSGITLSFGSHSVVINSSGVTIDGKVFLTHEHQAGTYVAPNGAVTGTSGTVV